MTQLDGHTVQTETVLSDADPDQPFATARLAGCSCGWRGTTAHTPELTPDPDDPSQTVDLAEFSAEEDWRTQHAARLAATVPPADVADAVRAVGDQLLALVEDDRPMAALALIRIAGGGFPEQTRFAAQRASYLDYSWAQIGDALGTSKQSAWERYGRDLPQEDPVDQTTQRAALEAAVRTESGDWDTRRAIDALRAAGHQVTDKRARDILRGLQADGVLFRSAPTRAVYTALASARTTGR